VIVERFIVGDEHRLLVVGRRMVGRRRRIAVGHRRRQIHRAGTVRHADQHRPAPWRNRRILGLVKPHESGEIVLELQRQGMTTQSVPGDGVKVLIQPNGNVAIDVTDKVHPQVAAWPRWPRAWSASTSPASTW
jgi:cyanophycin synthetase